MSDTNETEARAKRRLMSLSLVRLAGMALVIAGLQIWLKGAFGLQDESIGKAVAVVGIACVFLLPALLRRRWRENP